MYKVLHFVAMKNIHAETVRLLQSRPKALTIRKISKDTGLGEEWIKSVLYELSRDPGVNKIQALYAYLEKEIAIAVNTR